jgi:heat shock protein HslJ
MNKLVVLGTIIVFAAACSSGTSPSELWQAQGMWKLQAIGSSTIPNPDSYTLHFSGDGRVQVRADCNHCSGGYETNGNAITIGPLACTRAYCGDDSFFDAYVAGLTSASAFARRGETLELTSSAGSMSFRVSQ